MAKGNFEQFLEDLGAQESGPYEPEAPLKQYEAQNSDTNATGKYQFTELVFEDLGFYIGDDNIDDGVFNGTWRSRNGVTSIDSWKANPAAQETAIRESFARNIEGIDRYDGPLPPLTDNAYEYLDNPNNQGEKTVIYYKLANNDFEVDENGDKIIETTVVNEITLSSILAGAHLRGGLAAKEILERLNGNEIIDFTTDEFDLEYYQRNLFDEIGTSIFKYLNDFGDYTVSDSDFILPSYGDENNYVLYGTLRDDILRGGNGSDILVGGSGNDTFVLIPGEGTDTITDWEQPDVIGLSGGIGFSDLSFSGSDIILTSTSEVLATLTGIDTTTLIESDFTIV